MIKQITVFIQNKIGRIAAITRLLYENGLNLRAISIADTEDFGILRILVDDQKKAEEVLTEKNVIVEVTDVVVVAVPDRPGGLSKILDLLNDKEISIEYMYSLIDRGQTSAYMVFRASDNEEMIKVLKESGYETVEGEKLGLR